jgi:predicted TPR repeat methyltransferase
MADTGTLLASARECLRARDFDAAETLLGRAIAENPGAGLAYELLGKLLYRDCRAAEAAAVYQAWLHAIPHDPIAAHLVAATGAAVASQRASDGFITGLFDRAAPEFDAALRDLGYQAPQLLFEIATQVLGPPAGPAPDARSAPDAAPVPRAASGPGAASLAVLDLGCGTGLCGDLFRPLAARLTGVDLSPGMLDQAQRRGCYDELVCAELTSFARGCSRRFDLILACDVFCYFGDLVELLTAVRKLLRDDGWILFSVEDLTHAPHAPLDAPNPAYSSKRGCDYSPPALKCCGSNEVTLYAD